MGSLGEKVSNENFDLLRKYQWARKKKKMLSLHSSLYNIDFNAPMLLMFPVSRVEDAIVQKILVQISRKKSIFFFSSRSFVNKKQRIASSKCLTWP